MLRFNLMGDFEVRSDQGERVALPGAKAECLLALLALDLGKRQRRERFHSLLWGDRGDTQARGSLRQLLWTLKKSFEEAGQSSPLCGEGEEIWLDPDLVATDLARFEALALREEREALEGAADLYRGELLAGISLPDEVAEHRLLVERQRLQGRAIAVLKALLDRQWAAGDRVAATGSAQRLLSLDPLLEEAHCSLIRLFAERGLPGLALQQYALCRELLERDLGVLPSGETEAARAMIGRPVSPADARKSEPDGGRLLWWKAMRPTGRRTVTLVLSTVLLCGALWVGLEQRSKRVPRSEAPARELPPGPSLAVLPFEERGEDVPSQALAQGLATALFDELSKISGLFVIGPQSGLAAGDAVSDPPAIARQLGVGHLVGGSLERSGERLRITAWLIDGETGEEVWSQGFERLAAALPSLEGEVAAAVLAALAVKLTDSEESGIARVPTSNLEAYDLYLRAEEKSYLTADAESSRALLDLYARAIRLDPTYADAYAGYARTAAEIWQRDLNDLLIGAIARKQAFAAASAALRLDPDNARAFMVLAIIQLVDSEHALAIASAKRAVRLQPSNPEARATLALVLAYSGEREAALAEIDFARRLRPRPKITLLILAGMVYTIAGQPERAIAELESALALLPDSETLNEFLAAAHAMSGNEVRAASASASLLASFPAANLNYFRTMYDYYRPEAERERYLEALGRAGFPDWPYGFVPDDADQVPARDLPRLAIDRTWAGRNQTGIAFVQTIGPRGDLAYHSEKSLLTGRAQIRGDRICQRFDGYFLNRDLCGRVYRNTAGDGPSSDGLDYVFVSPESIRYFSLQQ